jgi:hypothetical protein
MSENVYQCISFWIMTFAIALWGLTCERPTIEPSYVVMALLAASIWTLAFGWGTSSAATEAPSPRDKFLICIISVSLLAIAIASGLLGWASDMFLRDMPIIVLPMSVGIGIAYMFGATIRRNVAREDRIQSGLNEA